MAFNGSGACVRSIKWKDAYNNYYGVSVLGFLEPFGLQLDVWLKMELMAKCL